jgi:tetratricopeptide (TPR) repeat protein
MEVKMPAKPFEYTLGASSITEWITLASNYQDVGHYRDAIRLYLRILELEPTQNLETILGVLLELSGEPEQSLVEHHRAVRKNPNDAASFAGLAGLLHRLYSEEKARPVINQARSNIKPNTSYYTLACLEAIDGNVDEALNNLSYALKRSPQIRQWAIHDPDLLLLRDLPPFEDLVNSL